MNFDYEHQHSFLLRLEQRKSEFHRVFGRVTVFFLHFHFMNKSPGRTLNLIGKSTVRVYWTVIETYSMWQDTAILLFSIIEI